VSFVFLSSGLGELENGLLEQQQKGTNSVEGVYMEQTAMATVTRISQNRLSRAKQWLCMCLEHSGTFMCGTLL